MALDFFDFTRPSTVDVTDAEGSTETVSANVPAFDFNNDGTYKGLKWTSDSEATKTDAEDLLGQTEGRVIFEVDTLGGIVSIGGLSANISAGVRKIEFRYTQTKQELFIDGSKVSEVTSSFSYSTMDKIELGHDDGADQPTDVHYRLLAIYKTANQ